MSEHIVTVETTDPTSKAVSRLMEFNVGSVLVIDDNEKLAGIITKGDVMRKVVLKGLNPFKTESGKVMSVPVSTISSNETIEEASRLMSDKKISKLAVLKEGKLVGIVTSTDIIRTEPEEVEYLRLLIRARFVPSETRSANSG
jgi:CBS domain-containing protein